MSTLSISELRKLSEEVGRSASDQLHLELADLLSAIEREQPTIEAVTEGIRAILDRRYVAGAGLAEPVR